MPCHRTAFITPFSTTSRNITQNKTMTVPASPTQAGETQARASLRCFNDKCGARFPIADVLYNCPTCGGLIEVVYADRPSDSESLKRTFRERRMSNDPLNASGVWR